MNKNILGLAIVMLLQVSTAYAEVISAEFTVDKVEHFKTGGMIYIKGHKGRVKHDNGQSTDISEFVSVKLVHHNEPMVDRCVRAATKGTFYTINGKFKSGVPASPQFSQAHLELFDIDSLTCNPVAEPLSTPKSK